MKRFSGCSDVKLWSALIIIALFFSFSGAGIAANLLPKNAVFKGEVTDKKGAKFPSTLRIISMNESTGDFTGEVTWHSLNSVHKIEGRVKGSTC